MKSLLRETKREEKLMYGTCREMAPKRPSRTCMSPTSLDKNRLARFRPGLGIRARVHVPRHHILTVANLVICLLRDYFSLTREDLPSSTPSPPRHDLLIAAPSSLYHTPRTPSNAADMVSSSFCLWRLLLLVSMIFLSQEVVVMAQTCPPANPSKPYE